MLLPLNLEQLTNFDTQKRFSDQDDRTNTQITDKRRMDNDGTNEIQSSEKSQLQSDLVTSKGTKRITDANKSLSAVASPKGQYEVTQPPNHISVQTSSLEGRQVWSLHPSSGKGFLTLGEKAIMGKLPLSSTTNNAQTQTNQQNGGGGVFQNRAKNSCNANFIHVNNGRLSIGRNNHNFTQQHQQCQTQAIMQRPVVSSQLDEDNSLLMHFKKWNELNLNTELQHNKKQRYAQIAIKQQMKKQQQSAARRKSSTYNNFQCTCENHNTKESQPQKNFATTTDCVGGSGENNLMNLVIKHHQQKRISVTAGNQRKRSNQSEIWQQVNKRVTAAFHSSNQSTSPIVVRSSTEFRKSKTKENSTPLKGRSKSKCSPQKASNCGPKEYDHESLSQPPVISNNTTTVKLTSSIRLKNQNERFKHINSNRRPATQSQLADKCAKQQHELKTNQRMAMQAKIDMEVQNRMNQGTNIQEVSDRQSSGMAARLAQVQQNSEANDHPVTTKTESDEQRRQSTQAIDIPAEINMKAARYNTINTHHQQTNKSLKSSNLDHFGSAKNQAHATLDIPSKKEDRIAVINKRQQQRRISGQASWTLRKSFLNEEGQIVSSGFSSMGYKKSLDNSNYQLTEGRYKIPVPSTTMPGGKTPQQQCYIRANEQHMLIKKQQELAVAVQVQQNQKASRNHRESQNVTQQLRHQNTLITKSPHSPKSKQMQQEIHDFLTSDIHFHHHSRRNSREQQSTCCKPNCVASTLKGNQDMASSRTARITDANQLPVNYEAITQKDYIIDNQIQIGGASNIGNDEKASTISMVSKLHTNIKETNGMGVVINIQESARKGKHKNNLQSIITNDKKPMFLISTKKRPTGISMEGNQTQVINQKSGQANQMVKVSIDDKIKQKNTSLLKSPKTQFLNCQQAIKHKKTDLKSLKKDQEGQKVTLTTSVYDKLKSQLRFTSNETPIENSQIANTQADLSFNQSALNKKAKNTVIFSKEAKPQMANKGLKGSVVKQRNAQSVQAQQRLNNKRGFSPINQKPQNKHYIKADINKNSNFNKLNYALVLAFQQGVPIFAPVDFVKHLQGKNKDLLVDLDQNRLVVVATKNISGQAAMNYNNDISEFQDLSYKQQVSTHSKTSSQLISIIPQQSHQQNKVVLSTTNKKQDPIKRKQPQNEDLSFKKPSKIENHVVHESILDQLNDIYDINKSISAAKKTIKNKVDDSFTRLHRDYSQKQVLFTKKNLKYKRIFFENYAKYLIENSKKHWRIYFGPKKNTLRQYQYLYNQKNFHYSNDQLLVQELLLNKEKQQSNENQQNGIETTPINTAQLIRQTVSQYSDDNMELQVQSDQNIVFSPQISNRLSPLILKNKQRGPIRNKNIRVQRHKSFQYKRRISKILVPMVNDDKQIQYHNSSQMIPNADQLQALANKTNSIRLSDGSKHTLRDKQNEEPYSPVDIKMKQKKIKNNQDENKKKSKQKKTDGNKGGGVTLSSGQQLESFEEGQVSSNMMVSKMYQQSPQKERQLIIGADNASTRLAKYEEINASDGAASLEPQIATKVLAISKKDELKINEGSGQCQQQQQLIQVNIDGSVSPYKISGPNSLLTSNERVVQGASGSNNLKTTINAQQQTGARSSKTNSRASPQRADAQNQVTSPNTRKQLNFTTIMPYEFFPRDILTDQNLCCREQLISNVDSKNNDNRIRTHDIQDKLNQDSKIIFDDCIKLPINFNKLTSSHLSKDVSRSQSPKPQQAEKRTQVQSSQGPRHHGLQTLLGNQHTQYRYFVRPGTNSSSRTYSTQHQSGCKTSKESQLNKFFQTSRGRSIFNFQSENQKKLLKQKSKECKNKFIEIDRQDKRCKGQSRNNMIVDLSYVSNGKHVAIKDIIPVRKTTNISQNQKIISNNQNKIPISLQQIQDEQQLRLVTENELSIYNQNMKGIDKYTSDKINFSKENEDTAQLLENTTGGSLDTSNRNNNIHMLDGATLTSKVGTLYRNSYVCDPNEATNQQHRIK